MASKIAPKAAPITTLTEVGNFRKPIGKSHRLAWAAELKDSQITPERARRLKLWLAEYELAGKEEPESAAKMFEAVLKDAPKKSPIRGHAWMGMALSYQRAGRYEWAADELKKILKSDVRGLDWNSVAFLAKHAESCSEYHKERARAGIVEPTHLDPLCGASSLAIALKHFSKPHDKPLMEKSVYHTGFGSNMGDVPRAAKRFGLIGVSLTLNEDGLRAILKEGGGAPVVTRVEHDHFVSVTATDDEGVTYWCSDCGPWPGGSQKVTWKQWRMMEADAFLAIADPKTPYGQALSALSSRTFTEVFSLVASTSQGGVQGITEFQRIVAALQNASVSIFWLPDWINCGIPPQATPCADDDCIQDCPIAMPLEGVTEDPVNVARGTETYSPSPMLHVYNPIGPSVTWGHGYNSMANTVPNGFGAGWYHPYLYTIRFKVGGHPAGPVGSVPDSRPGSNEDPPEEESFGGGGGGGGEMDGPGNSYGYMIHPNSATSSFSVDSSTVPTSGTPTIDGDFDLGRPYDVQWVYSATAPGNSQIIVTKKDRTKMTFSQLGTPGSPNTERFYYLTRITDRMGNYIDLNWAGTYSFKSFNIFMATNVGYALSTIKDQTGATLLTLGYGASYGRIVSASDCYNRSIYYETTNFNNVNVPGHIVMQNLDELTAVSQVVTTGSGSPPAQYQYEYTQKSNWEGTETVAYLWKIKTVNPTGSGMSTATIGYDSIGYVTSVTDANGNKMAITELTGNYSKIAIKDSSNNTVAEYTLGWDANMSLAYIKNASNNTVASFAFSDANTPFRPTTVTDGNSRVWTYDWDQYNNLLSAETPKGTETTYAYSYSNFSLGELEEVQEGTKTASTFTYYQPSGLVESVSTSVPGEVGQANWQTTEFDYDSLGNLTEIIAPGNNSVTTKTTTLNYTTDGGYSQSAKIGQPVKVTDPLGKVWHFRYNSRGTISSAWDPNGNTVTPTYNIVDQTTEVAYPATGSSGSGSSKVQNSYLFPGGHVTQVRAYNENNSLIRTVDFTYGNEGELLTRTGSAELVTLTYDAAYRTKTLKDGNNNTTTYSYNTDGHLSQIAYPGATGTYYDKIQFTSYDVVGNLLTRIDGRGITTTYTYGDADGLLTAVDYTGYSSQSVDIEYDAYGRPTEITDGTGVSTATYDDLDNVVEADRTYTGIATKTFEYTYYPDGSRETMVNPAGTSTYYYDANGRPTSMSSPAGTVSYQYLDNGWLSKRTLPNGAYTDYGYNAVGALTSLANKKSGGTNLSTYGTFSYDGVFNLTGVTASNIATSNQNGATSWTYDSKDRMTQEASARLGSYTQNFAYDNSGNPTTWKGSTYSFNSNNQRSATGYTFDGNGNPTTYASATMTYDVENRLTGIGSSWTAGYRADGLRAWKDNGTTRTYFLYDGGLPVVEMNSSGTTTAYSVYGPDGLVARNQNSTTFQYVFDQQGNIAQRLDGSGNVITSSVYDAYGVENSSGSPVDPFGYNAQWGYYLDRETGLYACMYRYYDPGQGRWVHRDAISYRGGINLYSYTKNSPNYNIDAQGLTSVASPHGAAISTWAYAEIFGEAAGAATAGLGIALLLQPRPGTTHPECDTSRAPIRPGVDEGHPGPGKLGKPDWENFPLKPDKGGTGPVIPPIDPIDPDGDGDDFNRECWDWANDQVGDLMDTFPAIGQILRRAFYHACVNGIDGPNGPAGRDSQP